MANYGDDIYPEDHGYWKGFAWGVIWCLILTYPMRADAFQVCWTTPDENVDGTPLTDLSKTRVYYGVASGDYTHQEDSDTADIATQYCLTVVPPAPGDYFVAATAIDAEGNESAFSNEVVKNEAPSVIEFELTGIQTVFLGDDLTVNWTGGEVEIQWLEYGKTFPTRSATKTDSWTFPLERAGLYYVRARKSAGDNWTASDSQNLVWQVKLKTPTGGGVIE